jgi:hypothetical protein
MTSSQSSLVLEVVLDRYADPIVNDVLTYYVVPWKTQEFGGIFVFLLNPI